MQNTVCLGIYKAFDNKRCVMMLHKFHRQGQDMLYLKRTQKPLKARIMLLNLFSLRSYCMGFIKPARSRNSVIHTICPKRNATIKVLRPKGNISSYIGIYVHLVYASCIRIMRHMMRWCTLYSIRKAPVHLKWKCPVINNLDCSLGLPMLLTLSDHYLEHTTKKCFTSIYKIFFFF